MVFQDYTRFEGLFPCPDLDHGLYYSPMDANGYSTWLEIDLDALQNNVRQLHQITGNEVMAIVKANGYGHGAVPAARAAVEAGANWCGVGRLEEAMSLRHAGLDCRILIMGFTPSTGITEAIANHISVTVYDYEQAKQYSEQALAAGKPVSIHVKVDTGMGRLGMMAKDAPEFLHWLKHQDGLFIEGVFTHFARADEPQVDLTANQLERFFSVLDKLKPEGINPEVIHAANSAGAIYFPDARFTLVRAGIALYGLDPSHKAVLPTGFRPALTWKALLTSVKVFPPGHGISYGSIYTTKGHERIGTIPAGYADGFRRVTGNQVLVGGRRVPVVGKVCMDQSAILLEDVPDARVGDEVVLLGHQGQERISAEEIGDRWGTVNYEVVCGLANRLPRLYQ